MTIKQLSYTLATLVKDLPDVRIQGDETCIITGIAPIQHAKAGDITFLTNASYKKFLATTQATAVILSDADAVECPSNIVISSNPYYIYSQIAHYFAEKIPITPGIHHTVVIGEHCHIDETASIGPYTVIGNDVSIGKHAVIGANCAISDHVSIADHSRLDARVTLYHDVQLGKYVHIASGAVIGSDGFGLASYQKKWHAIPQLGGVRLGDYVAIGANTTIDRGALNHTILEEGVKLDNLIQVGHNVHIGAHTVIAGCVAIAGSAKIGRHCMIGGASNIAGHLEIADGVAVTGNTAVTKSIMEPGLYSSGIVGAVPNQEFRKNNAWFHRLGNLVQRVKELESTLKQLLSKRDT